MQLSRASSASAVYGVSGMPDISADMTATPCMACITSLDGVMQMDACVAKFVTGCKADPKRIASAPCT